MEPGKEIRAGYSETDLSPSEFSHSAWSSTQPVHITQLWSGEQAPASRHAEVRVIWSDAAMCVRFICNQQEPLTISRSPKIDVKTIGLWNRDVCEIFVAPDADQPQRYLEFEAAPTGEWVDLTLDTKAAPHLKDFKFQSGMTVAAFIEEGRITICMRIPWSESLPKPRPGDEWRANLFRCVGVGNERYLAWQPTGTEEPNFHVPEVFGWLRFDA
ncbi:MAG: carbohydrate-binding family 9-like protein [Acidobacteriota bacterium]|nr:carbohydrate-binding family 9-like protein [Acidobacteriota bacterium]